MSDACQPTFAPIPVFLWSGIRTETVYSCGVWCLWQLICFIHGCSSRYVACFVFRGSCSVSPFRFYKCQLERPCSHGFRSFFTVKKTLHTVEVSRLGFLYAKHQARKLFGVDEKAWRQDKWVSLITVGLKAFTLFLPNVHYAAMRHPDTGKKTIILIDRSTSAFYRCLHVVCALLCFSALLRVCMVATELTTPSVIRLRASLMSTLA